MESFIFACQQLSVESFSLIALVCYLAILLMLLRLFGVHGVITYVIVAIVASNIHILKIVQYEHLKDPLAYGTILFSTIFLALGILTEFYGKDIARKAANLGLAAMFVMAVFMMSALGVKPATTGQELYQCLEMSHTAMMHLFLPQPAFFLASFIAYYVTQHLDISLFYGLSRLTNKRFLWLRTCVSTSLSTVIDNTLFSLLAWMVFAPHPLPWSVVLSTYILTSLGMRLCISILYTPVISLARYFCQHPHHHTERKAS